jgi:hypothetical protein
MAALSVPFLCLFLRFCFFLFLSIIHLYAFFVFASNLYSSISFLYVIFFIVVVFLFVTPFFSFFYLCYFPLFLFLSLSFWFLPLSLLRFPSSYFSHFFFFLFISGFLSCRFHVTLKWRYQFTRWPFPLHKHGPLVPCSRRTLTYVDCTHGGRPVLNRVRCSDFGTPRCHWTPGFSSVFTEPVHCRSHHHTALLLRGKWILIFPYQQRRGFEVAFSFEVFWQEFYRPHIFIFPVQVSSPSHLILFN